MLSRKRRIILTESCSPNSDNTGAEISPIHWMDSSLENLDLIILANTTEQHHFLETRWIHYYLQQILDIWAS